MTVKLSAKQVSQLAYLQRLPPKIQRINALVEQMGVGSADETALRSMIRMLDEMKSGASQLSIGGLAEALGSMAATARRGGGLQVKVRGLKDLMGGVRTNYEIGLKKAMVPEAEGGEGSI
jgi:hypothetical protein